MGFAVYGGASLEFGQLDCGGTAHMLMRCQFVLGPAATRGRPLYLHNVLDDGRVVVLDVVTGNDLDQGSVAQILAGVPSANKKVGFEEKTRQNQGLFLPVFPATPNKALSEILS